MEQHVKKHLNIFIYILVPLNIPYLNPCFLGNPLTVLASASLKSLNHHICRMFYSPNNRNRYLRMLGVWCCLAVEQTVRRLCLFSYIDESAELWELIPKYILSIVVVFHSISSAVNSLNYPLAGARQNTCDKSMWYTLAVDWKFKNQNH